jgi:hypothetical protein
VAAGVHAFPRKEGDTGVGRFSNIVWPNCRYFMKKPCPGSQPEKYMILFIIISLIVNYSLLAY